MARLIALGDLHCGHRAGLAPPGYQYPANAADPDTKWFAKTQRKLWRFYADLAEKYQPVDVLLCNGDAIDGQAEINAGMELMYSDVDTQVEMAVECLKLWKAKRVLMTFGTRYHTGKKQNWERAVARELGANIRSVQWFEVEGNIINARHKCSRSVIPHGRHTGPSREALWNVIKADRKAEPRASIFLRSHVHYYTFAGDDKQLVMTLPALEGPWTDFGIRECDGLVHFGLTVFDINGPGDWTWKPELWELAAAAPTVIKI